MVIVYLFGLAFFLLWAIVFYLDRTTDLGPFTASEIKAKALNDVKARIADLKQAGVPVDDRSLKAFYSTRVSPEESAAWLQVFRHVGSDEFKAQSAGVYPFIDEEPTGQMERVRQARFQRALLQRNSQFLADLHDLAANNKTTPKYINDAARPTRDYISEVYSLMALLTCEILVNISDRKAACLLTSVKTQFSLLFIHPCECSEVNYWCRSNLELAIISGIRMALEANVLDQADLRILIDDLEAISDATLDWRHLVNHMRVQALARLNTKLNFNWCSPSQAKIKRVSGNDLLRFLESMEQFENVDWFRWKAAKEHLASIQRSLPESVASDFSFRILSGSAETLAFVRSTRNQTVLACALQLYCLIRGTYPDSLEQLAEIGVAPSRHLSMADQPFGYQHRNGSAYLWGPVRDSNDHFPFEVVPTIPTYSSYMLPDERSCIDQALWTLRLA
jgi:hypothetical protein